MIEIMEIGHKSIGVIKNDFDCVVFVSKNAVRFGLPVVRESSISLKGKTIFAIGPRTAQALVDAGIKHPITPDKIYNSEGLLDSSAFKEVISDKKRVLVFRATKGRELLASTLLHCAEGEGSFLPTKLQRARWSTTPAGKGTENHKIEHFQGLCIFWKFPKAAPQNWK